jgi:DNA-binding response OmpR family regulator
VVQAPDQDRGTDREGQPGERDGDPNIVEVYVGQLRARVDRPFGRSSLQTVRLVGYRLDPDGG